MRSKFSSFFKKNVTINFMKWKEKIKEIIRIKFKFLKWLFFILIGALILYFAYGIFISPEREGKVWEFGQEKLPKVLIQNKNIKIENLRDFDWSKKEKNKIEKYKDFEFSLDEIQSVDLLISHFTKQEFIAHVFVIFNLKNGENFGVSIESRRIAGQKFSIFGGMWYKYNLIYVVATEKDLISLREKRNEKLYRYHLILSPEESQKLFLNLARKEDELVKKPEFYNTIFTNCTNLLVEEMEKVRDFDFPFLEKYFLPGYTDEALYEENLLDKVEIFPQPSWEDYKEKHLLVGGRK